MRRIICIISALWLTQFIPPVLLAGEELQTFGYVTDSDPRSVSPRPTTITAWFNNKVYQCDTWPYSRISSYHCEAQPKNLIGCDFTNNDTKMLIHHPWRDAVIADRFFLTTTNQSTYVADGFCIPKNDSFGRPENHKTDDVDNICTGGASGEFDLYYALCVDNDQSSELGPGNYACGPEKQFIYFDVEDAAEWEDGSGSISIKPCNTSECAALGDELSVVHESPPCKTKNECICEAGDTCSDTDTGYYCNSIEDVSRVLSDDEAVDGIIHCAANGGVCCCHCSSWLLAQCGMPTKDPTAAPVTQITQSTAILSDSRERQSSDSISTGTIGIIIGVTVGCTMIIAGVITFIFLVWTKRER
eukprot:1068311_1